MHAKKIEELGMKNPLRGNRQPLVLMEANNIWYNGVLGRISFLCKSKYSGQDPQQDPAKRRALIEEKVIFIVPFLMRVEFEIRIKNCFGQISRTLRSYPFMEQDAAMKLCRIGDVEGL